MQVSSIQQLSDFICKLISSANVWETITAGSCHNLKPLIYMKNVIFTILFLCMGWNAAQAQFAGGAGTESDPYQVATLEQLQSIHDHLDLHFVLVSDIDASATEGWNEGAGFHPIGLGVVAQVPVEGGEEGETEEVDVDFTGSLDGAGYTISNLHINLPGESVVGLFSRVGHGGVLKNVGIESAQVTASSDAGILAGQVHGGQIQDSYTTGVISGDDTIGGLVGEHIEGSQTLRSYSAAEVAATGRRNGGLIGDHRESEIIASFATGSVTGNEVTGGLVGFMRSGGKIIDSYATASVTVTNRRYGGLVGHMRDDESEVSGSYAAGAVSGTGSAEGGLIGLRNDDGPITSSYWDIEATGVATDGVDVTGSAGLTTAQMTGAAALANMAGLDFDQVWVLTEGYPALYWEDVEALPTNIEPVAELPEIFKLEQNYPNPFNPSTIIEFSLPQNGNVVLEVFNIQGQHIATLVNGSKDAGVHSVNFDASNLASGLYLYRIQAEGFNQVKKMMLVK
jgi:hypothetical protein